MERGQVAPGGDDHHPGVAHERGQEVTAARPLAEQGNGEQGQGDGPGIVDGLGFLGREQGIGLEEDAVVKEGVERAEQGRI